MLGECGELNTCDDPPVAVASLPAELLQAQKPPLVAGDAVRCAIVDLVASAEGDAVGAVVEFREFGGNARAGGDSWSKVVFQYNARNNPLTMEELLACACSGPRHVNGTDDCWFFIDNAGQGQGPFDLGTMQAWYLAGQLLPTTMVRNNQDGSFRPAETSAVSSAASSVGIMTGTQVGEADDMVEME